MEATSVKAKKNKQPINRGNIILAVISALLAVLIWVFLSVTVFTDVTVDLYDVGIDFDLEGSYANLAGLSVISSDVDSVNLSFTGRRDSYQDYTNEDVHIKLNLDNVKASGSYDIPLIAESTKGDRISDVVMVPESVHIVFDRIDTKILSFDDGTLPVALSVASTVLYPSCSSLSRKSSCISRSPMDLPAACANVSRPCFRLQYVHWQMP